MINKFGYQNLLISFLLIYFVYLTVDYNWWENFTISKIDYLIIVISFFSILLRKYFLYVYIVLFLIFLVNAGFSIALLSNFILFLFIHFGLFFFKSNKN